MSFKNYLGTQLHTQRYAQLYSCRDKESLIQRLCVSAKLEVHSGCVNTISWSVENPSLILSGSDDQTLAITDVFLNQVYSLKRKIYTYNVPILTIIINKIKTLYLASFMNQSSTIIFSNGIFSW